MVFHVETMRLQQRVRRTHFVTDATNVINPLSVPAYRRW
jgi:hypothetical protein